MLAVLLLVAAVVDVRTRTVPNGLVLAGLGIRVALLACEAVATGADGGDIAGCACLARFAWRLAECAGAGLAAAGPALAVALAMEGATGRQAFGGGDVKLLFMAGTYVSAETGLAALFCSCVVGAAMGIAVRAAGSVRTARAERATRADGAGATESAAGVGDSAEKNGARTSAAGAKDDCGDDANTGGAGAHAPEQDGTVPFAPAIAAGFLFTLLLGAT